MSAYAPPLDKLLELGDVRKPREWPDYLGLGLTAEHIPDLIRMVTDKELLWADSESREVWAPIHAWRALGLLRAEAAIEPLLQLFQDLLAEDDDWVIEELPTVFGMIGPPAIPALIAALADETRDLYVRTGASNGLVETAKRFPESRSQCVAAIIHQLNQFDVNDETLNGFLISDLIDLKAVEAAPDIEMAFLSNNVDEFVTGDWEDVQVLLGLKEAPPPSYRIAKLPPETTASPPPLFAYSRPLPAPSKSQAKAKGARQQAKKSRKVNRKRK